MGLLSEIGEGTGPIGLDSAIFIYFIERNPLYLSVVRPIFKAIDEGRFRGVTCSLTLMETLVAPLRAGNAIVAHQYERFLTHSSGLTMVPIDQGLLRAAAHVRAAARLKTPDALQVAAVLSMGCTVFLTNDHRIPEISGLRILQVEDYSEP